MVAVVLNQVVIAWTSAGEKAMVGCGIIIILTFFKSFDIVSNVPTRILYESSLTIGESELAWSWLETNT
jgi:hypothetical protein